MSSTRQPDRAESGRLADTTRVRFSVNGGPEISSDTLDFTCRNLALRSESRVAIGDRVVARIGCMSPLEGVVLRVWDEGFAIALSAGSMEIVARSIGDERPALVIELDGVRRVENAARIVSPYFKLGAEEPTWCRIASTRPAGGDRRHQVSVITQKIIDGGSIRSVWLTVARTRWIIRLVSAGLRNDHSILVLRLNDWQVQTAARHGLNLSVVTRLFDEWNVSATPDSMRAHLERLAGPDDSL